MKKLLLSLAILVHTLAFGQFPKQFNNGIKIPNLTENINATRVPVVDNDGTILNFITAQNLISNNLTPTEISIRNENGVEQFKVSNQLRFVGVKFDAADKSVTTEAKSTNTAFVHSTLGNNNTAEFENGNKPYQSLQYALDTLSETGENPSKFVRFVILDDATYELNNVVQGLINFEIHSDFRCTIDLSNNTNARLWYTSNPTNEFNVTFNLPNGTLKRDNGGGNGCAISYEDLLLRINVGTIETNSSNGFLGGRKIHVSNLQTLVSSGSGATFTRVDGDISISELVVNNTQHDPITAKNVSGFITFKKISGTGGYYFRPKSATEATKYVVGDISTSLQCKLHYTGTSGQQVDIEFKNSTITTPDGILLGLQTVGNTTISGNIKSSPRIDFSGTRMGTVRLVNFVADFGDGNIDIGDQMKLIIENSSLKFDGTMSSIGATALPDTIKIVNSAIEQRTPTTLTINGKATHTIEAGSLSTNATAIADNEDVNVTFKLVPLNNQ